MPTIESVNQYTARTGYNFDILCSSALWHEPSHQRLHLPWPYKRKNKHKNHSHNNFQEKWNSLYWSHRFYLPNWPYLKANRCKEFQSYPSTSDFRIPIEHSNLLNAKFIKWKNKMELSIVQVSAIVAKAHLVSYLIQEHKSTASLWCIAWHLSQRLTHQTSL